jgi:hypothetical protein
MSGIEALLNSPNSSGLRGLDFRALSGYAARFPALEPLFQSPRLAALTDLSIRYVGKDAADIRRFCDLPSVRQLESLRLADTDMDDETVQELVARPTFPKLRSLALTESLDLANEAIRALASSPHLGGLRSLDLFNNRGITDEGVQALAAAQHLRDLTDLDLRLTGVDDAGLRALIESPNLPRLSRIDLLDAKDWGKRFRLRRWLPKDSLFRTLWVRDVRK